MKTMTRVLAVALTMLPLFATAQLQSNEKIVAQVPFQFRIADKMVPAGKCTLEAATLDGRVLAIHNAGANVGLVTTSLPQETKRADNRYALIFHRYGDRYFLAAITIPGKRSLKLPKTSQEAELQARNVTATDEILLAEVR